MKRRRDLQFDLEIMKRLRIVCRVLGTTYQEFIEFAVRQALDEMEALAEEQQAIEDFYRQLTGKEMP